MTAPYKEKPPSLVVAEPGENLTDEQKHSWKRYHEYKYLGSHDLLGKTPTVTIERVQVEEVFNPRTNKSEDKTVLYFKGAKKPWILNVTNRKRITSIAGSEYFEDWIGKQVTLHTEKARNPNEGGAMTDAVYVKPERKRI